MCECYVTKEHSGIRLNEYLHTLRECSTSVSLQPLAFSGSIHTNTDIHEKANIQLTLWYLMVILKHTFTHTFPYKSVGVSGA